MLRMAVCCHFTTSWKYIKNNKPDEYSTDDVEKIAKNFKSDSTDKNSAKTRKCLM